jgi:Uma2 family endonuclease
VAATEKGLTLEQFLRLPEKKPALEYDDGAVTQKVSPRFRHARLQGELTTLVNQFGGPRKLALALPELRTTYDRRSTVPDVAIYVWDRIGRTSDGQYVDEYFTPPDIAIEIASPDQSATSLVRRCLWYAAHGVRVALLIDPDDQNVMLFRPNAVPQPLRGDDPIDVADVLPGFELRVAELFAVLKAD